MSHCPPRLPGQEAPCSPSWQEQTLGAMQKPLPQPKEQRAERRNAGEGVEAGPRVCPSPGNERLLGRMFGAQGQELTEGAVPTAHGGRPARAAATPKPREADVGAQPASAREERTPATFRWVCRGKASRASQSVNKQFSRPSGKALGSFQRKRTLTACPGGRTKTETPVSYSYWSHEQRAKSGQERGASVLRRKNHSG